MNDNLSKEELKPISNKTFRDYTILLTKLSRLIIFIMLIYLILKYIPDTKLTNREVCIMILLITILFVIIDYYYPNINEFDLKNQL